MVVVRSERRVTLRTFTLTRFVARSQTFPAEHVKTFREHSVFTAHLTRLTGKHFFILAHFLDEHDIRLL
jgi:hypothetical protein